MAKLLKLRRGSTTQHTSFIGAEGEVTIDTTKDTAVVHDGSQAGGRPLAREDMSNVSSASIAGQLGTDSIATTKIAGGALPTDVTVASANIVDGTIVNADINASAAIAGTKISPDFGSQNIATTGTIASNNLTITDTHPKIFLTDSNHNSDFRIKVDSGSFQIEDATNSNVDRFVIDSNGTVSVNNNLDVGAGCDVTGNITVTGTVDGRDVAADGSKLDTYEANGSSYVRSDASDTLTGGTYTLNSSTDEKIILSGSNNPYIRFQEGTTNKAYIQWVNSGIFQFVNSESGEYLRIKSGNNGLTFTAEGTERTVWHAGNDGSGSGLDADTLDGVDSGSFVRSDANDVLTGSYDFQHTGNYPVVIGDTTGMADAKMVLRGSDNPYIRFRQQNTDKAYMQWNSTGYVEIYNEHTSRSLRIKGGSSFLIANVGGTEHAVWHGGNDGSGSGLDADLLDGVQGANYLRSDTADTKSGSLNINGGTSHGANDATLYVDADNNNDWGLIVNKLNNGSTEYGIESRIASSSSFALSVLGGGTRVFRVGGNGDIVNNGSITANGNVTAYSDARLKTNVNTINDALSIVGKLRGVSFDWKKSGEHSIGVIAQEVEEVLPELVLTNHENIGTKEKPEYTDFKSVDYGKIVGVLINAINELKEELEIHKAECAKHHGEQ